jgi:hypothetical protein
VGQKDPDVAGLGQEEGLGDCGCCWVGAWRDADDCYCSRLAKRKIIIDEKSEETFHEKQAVGKGSQ